MEESEVVWLAWIWNLNYGVQAGFDTNNDNVFDEDAVLNAGPTVGIPNAQFVLGVATPPDVTAVIAGPNLPQDLYANLPNPRLFGVRVNARFGGD